MPPKDKPNDKPKKARRPVMRELFEKVQRGEATPSDFEACEMRLTHRVTEQVMRSMPHMVDFLIKQTAILKKTATKFYEDNPDLKEHKEFVAKIIEQVEAENPGLEYGKIIEKATPRIREYLKDKPVNNRRMLPDLKKLDASVGEL